MPSDYEDSREDEPARAVLRAVYEETETLRAQGLASVDYDPGRADETEKIRLVPANSRAAKLTLEIYSDDLFCVWVGEGEWEQVTHNRAELVEAAREWVRAVVAGRYLEKLPAGDNPRAGLIAEVELDGETQTCTGGLLNVLLGERGTTWTIKRYEPYGSTPDTAES